MALSKNAVYLLEQRYCRDGETPEDVFKRVSSFLFDEDETLKEKLYNAMTNGIFLPNSPCLYNAGVPNTTLNACFVIDIKDSIAGIFKAVSEMAQIFHYGGGVGLNFSSLREKDALLRTGGTSSGVVSFMRIFDTVTETVKQGGYRRGALLGALNVNHPEIFHFIGSKIRGDLQNFNISVMVNDEFMRKAETSGKIDLISPLGKKVESVKARDLFDIICFTAWNNGDPGLLFFDRINKDNPYFPEMVINSTNPCGEQPLPPYGSCCLGSINLGKMITKGEFNFERFIEYIRLGYKTLDKINQKSWYPIPEITETMTKYKPIGLGIMGFADALIKLGLYYDSQECLDFIDKVGKVFKETTEEDETPRLYRRSLAPTGSLSILANCSSGIEPIFDDAFERHLTIGVIEETRDLYKSEYTKTAHQISPEWHIKVQAQWQKWIDSGVSKTVNMPNSASVEDVKNVYKLAWMSQCKGVTIFRDGSKNTQVLYSMNKKQKCSDAECTL
jgi:ribonucleoside-diphosphate reductase alpha chain